MRTSGLFEENNETNTNSWEQMSDADTNSLGAEETDKDTTKKESISESDTSMIKEEADESNDGQLAKEDAENVKSKHRSEADSIEASEETAEDAVSLLYVKKEDGFYEFSVNLEKYRLQLVEISVNKKEDIVAITYSDFSSSVKEKLQAEVEDTSSYNYYVDSEGALYMEREDRYYQIQVEEKGDGWDGK